jgi:hypothetical protein
MGLIKFDIRMPNGQRESAVVESERALIGSASYCDVRLPMDQAAYEHVLIEVHGQTLRAEAKADKPEATINGMPFVSSALAQDAVLGIGAIRIYISFVSDLYEGPNIQKKKDESNPAIRVIGLAVFAVCAYVLLNDPEDPIAPPPDDKMALFADTAPACPQATPETALALAEEKLALADGKRERMPFDAREGVEAVPVYDLAIACFKAANREAQVKETEASRDSLKRTVSDDFRARKLRLAHMLKVEDFELAKVDVLVLQHLTAEKQGPYVEWLAGVNRRLYPKKVEQ